MYMSDKLFHLFIFVQVSWSVPHKQASSGTYQVKFFDEESYSTLRKVGKIKEWVKLKLANFLTLMSNQTCVAYLLLWSIKEDIMKNVF